MELNADRLEAYKVLFTLTVGMRQDRGRLVRHRKRLLTSRDGWRHCWRHAVICFLLEQDTDRRSCWRYGCRQPFPVRWTRCSLKLAYWRITTSHGSDKFSAVRGQTAICIWLRFVWRTFYWRVVLEILPLRIAWMLRNRFNLCLRNHLKPPCMMNYTPHNAMQYLNAVPYACCGRWA